MSQNRAQIVICKSLSSKNETTDVYKTLLEKAGYNTEFLPTISFEFINQSVLRESLVSPDSFSGLILTSPRSVEAIKAASKQEITILESWKKLPVYCVGPSTESLAKKELCLANFLGSECGNAENLARYIVESRQCKDKPILYPCSEIARDTVEKYLTENGFQVKKIISYKTVPCENLKQDVERILKSVPQVVVFFSPSVVENILSTLGEEAVILKEVKVVAIGTVTGRALTNAGIVVDAISEKPEPEALLQAIERSIGKDNKNVELVAETSV